MTTTQLSLNFLDYDFPYSSHLRLLKENSLLARARGVTPYDLSRLTQLIKNTTDYLLFCHNEGTYAHLGRIPHVINDVVTVFYGTSALPLVGRFDVTNEMYEHMLHPLLYMVGLTHSISCRRPQNIDFDYELAVDLVSSMCACTGKLLLEALKPLAAGQATKTWSKTPPYGQAFFEHKMSVYDALYEIQRSLGGDGSYALLAGRYVFSLIETLPHYIRHSDGTPPTLQLRGILDENLQFGFRRVLLLDGRGFVPDGKAYCIGFQEDVEKRELSFQTHFPLLMSTALPPCSVVGGGRNPLLNQKGTMISGSIRLPHDYPVMTFEVIP